MNNLLKNNKGGTVLLLTVLILTSVLTITLVASEIIRSGVILSRSQADSTKAYFAAEAGAERILWEVRKGTFDFSSCLSECISFDSDPNGNINGCGVDCNTGLNIIQTLSNKATYKIRYNYVDPDTTVKCYGKYPDSGINRVIELKF